MGYEFVNEVVLHQAGWVRLMKYWYRSPEGQMKSWELVERNNRTGKSDGITIMCI